MHVNWDEYFAFVDEYMKLFNFKVKRKKITGNLFLL